MAFPPWRRFRQEPPMDGVLLKDDGVSVMYARDGVRHERCRATVPRRQGCDCTEALERCVRGAACIAWNGPRCALHSDSGHSGLTGQPLAGALRACGTYTGACPVPSLRPQKPLRPFFHQTKPCIFWQFAGQAALDRGQPPRMLHSDREGTDSWIVGVLGERSQSCQGGMCALG